MSRNDLIIRGLSTISPLGASANECFRTFRNLSPRYREINGRPVFALTDDGNSVVTAVETDPLLSELDRTTQLAIAAARGTKNLIGRKVPAIGCVTIGSARGATTTLEKTFKDYEQGAVALQPHTSPRTTAGNISSWVAQEFAKESNEPIAAINTSMTCTSAFHSLLVSHAFVSSRMASAALFGGAESCLTPYTLAQLDALRIYSRQEGPWRCRPCTSADPRSNSVMLGEGAGCALLMPDDGERIPGDLHLAGIGWSLESIPSATGISEDGIGFEVAMQKALGSTHGGVPIDAVILHAPGTIKGDEAELLALERLLPGVPACTTKHLTGHTYGASGMVSLALAQILLNGGSWQGAPYPSQALGTGFESPRGVLINTAGFGGNTISIIVTHAGG